ncbi:serine hydrolase domain-containing protein [candidate division KSB1 bacterium]
MTNPISLFLIILCHSRVPASGVGENGNPVLLYMRNIFHFFYRTFLYSAKFLLVVAIIVSCSKQPTETVDYSYSIPEKTDDGWEVASLNDAEINIEQIEIVTDKIQKNIFKDIHSLLIVKNSAIVHEEYFNGYTRAHLQDIFSITKSVSSSLIGIAIDKGFITGVDDPVVSYLPQYLNDVTDEKMNEVTLKHILTLSSGMDWDEKTYVYEDPRNSENQMIQNYDWMKFVLSRSIINAPGTVWEYNTGSVHLLSAVIKNAAGLFADQFIEEYLFGPLGITDYDWNKDNMGYQCTGATLGGLRMKIRDLAKFALMILKNGKWNSEQIISESWVEESSTQHIVIPENTNNMGYLWWLGEINVNSERIDYIASYGYGEQTMYIVPKLDMIVIITCSAAKKDADIFLPVMMIFQAAVNN